MEKILIVDDVDISQIMLQDLLSPHYEVILADDGHSGCELAKLHRPDLILMDVVMPVLDGFEATKLLKASPLTADIPIIFITIADKIDDIIKAFEIGGVDYIIKPFNKLEVLSRVKTHINLVKSQKRVVEFASRSSVLAMGVTVNHDLRQPLQVLQAYFEKHLQNLKKHNIPYEQRDIEKINSAIVEMVKLLNKYGEDENFAIDEYLEGEEQTKHIQMVKYSR